MKKPMFRLPAILLAAGILVSCGSQTQSNGTMETQNRLTEQQKQEGILTPEVMWKMGRISGSVISPDGSRAVYAVTYYNMDENKGSSSLYLVDLAGGSPRVLTDGAGSDSSPSWNKQGNGVYFLSDRGGSDQIWFCNVESGAVTRLSNVKGGVEGYGISPDGTKAFYTQKVPVEKRQSSDIYPDLDKSKALIYDDLMARHWNYWDRGSYSHIFVSGIEGGKMEDGVDIMPGEPWDAPTAPYFDIHEIAWNNAGTQLAYTCKKQVGTEYAISTDSDIYIYDLASGRTENVTEGMVGYDKYPAFSPDDTKLAFTSMERPGNEADKERLMVLDLRSGNKTYLTANFDHGASNLIWDGNESLLFGSAIFGTYQVCRADMTGNVQIITSGNHDINSFSTAAGRTVCEMTTLKMATELFTLELADGALSQLTNVNAEIYDNIKMGDYQERWVTTTDGKKMLTWVVLPPDFDPTKKYPALLFCQGGPQSVTSQSWSYRWNFQLMAAQGYVAVACNRRGAPSFGQEWVDQISGDYSGQNIRDLLSAIDEVAKEPWCDESRLGCVGASYGGYSVFYLSGHHNKRFKAFISHCGIYNFESMYGHTEELFFVNNDYGGSFWSNDPVARRSYANSPHRFVQNWDTPILIITGLNDFRIPYSQSLEAFTGARLQGIPARLVAFEDEAHQVFKPQNSLTWNREFFGWLDKYVKNSN